MNEPFERELAGWLRDGPETGPRDGLDAVLDATRRTRQRPTWTFIERWLPMQLTMQRGIAPRQIAVLLLVALLLAAVAAATVLVGSQRRTAPITGLAGNGTLLYQRDKALWLWDGDAAPRRLDVGLGESLNPAHSPDGTRFAFWTRTGERTPYAIHVADADGSNARSVTGDMRLIPEPWGNITWAPDGSKVAFATSENGTNVLYVAPTDGSAPPTRIIEADGDRSMPIWSPDGRWIAYRLSLPLESGVVHQAVVAADGTGERILVSDTQPSAAFRGSQWSPDSSRIAYFRKEDGRNLVGIVDLDGTESILTPPDTEGFNPVWSPDGTQIAYTLAAGGVAIVEPDGTEVLRLAPGLADCAVTWAPDGTAIIGGGVDCSEISRIPLGDPSAAEAIAEGAIGGISWQRTAAP